jgi:hypothetical protein
MSGVLTGLVLRRLQFAGVLDRAAAEAMTADRRAEVLRPIPWSADRLQEAFGEALEVLDLIGTHWWRREPRLRVHHGKLVVLTVVGLTVRSTCGEGMPMLRVTSSASRASAKPSNYAIGWLLEQFEQVPNACMDPECEEHPALAP